MGFACAGDAEGLSFSSFEAFSIPVFVQDDGVDNRSLVSFLVGDRGDDECPRDVISEEARGLFRDDCQFGQLGVVKGDREDFVRVSGGEFLYRCYFNQFRALQPYSRMWTSAELWHVCERGVRPV